MAPSIRSFLGATVLLTVLSMAGVVMTIVFGVKANNLVADGKEVETVLSKEESEKTCGELDSGKHTRTTCPQDPGNVCFARCEDGYTGLHQIAYCVVQGSAWQLWAPKSAGQEKWEPLDCKKVQGTAAVAVAPEPAGEEGAPSDKTLSKTDDAPEAGNVEVKEPEGGNNEEKQDGEATLSSDTDETNAVAVEDLHGCRSEDLEHYELDVDCDDKQAVYAATSICRLKCMRGVYDDVPNLPSEQVAKFQCTKVGQDFRWISVGDVEADALRCGVKRRCNAKTKLVASDGIDLDSVKFVAPGGSEEKAEETGMRWAVDFPYSPSSPPREPTDAKCHAKCRDKGRQSITGGKLDEVVGFLSCEPVRVGPGEFELFLVPIGWRCSTSLSMTQITDGAQAVVVQTGGFVRQWTGKAFTTLVRPAWNAFLSKLSKMASA